ncbi:hypothetical protein V8F06_014187 [Rhypophila decipiens]
MGCFSSKPTPPPSPSRPSRPTKRPPHKPPPPRISVPSTVQRSPSVSPSPSSVALAPTASGNVITYQIQEPPSESPSPKRRRVSHSPAKRSSTASLATSGYKHYSTPSPGPDATDFSPSYGYYRPSAAETRQPDNRPSRSDTKKSNSRTPTPPSTRTRAPSSISQRTPILLYEKDSEPTLHRGDGPSPGVHKIITLIHMPFHMNHTVESRHWGLWAETARHFSMMTDLSVYHSF